MKDYDFCGWATKNDILCDDGRIIKKDAFKGCDGMTVPLVYNHDHKDIDNVLGHCVLQNCDDGVYCYGYIDRNSKNGPQALSLLKNGSMKSLSIFANKLKEVGHNVVHGIIREVSLVLAGANKGAVIDMVLAHGVDASDEEDAVIVYCGDENPINHDGLDENESLEHSAEEEFDEMAVLDSMTDAQKKLMMIMMGRAAEDAENSVSHASKADKEEDEEDPDDGTDDDDDDDEDDDELEHSKSADDEDEDKKKSCSRKFKY